MRTVHIPVRISFWKKTNMPQPQRERHREREREWEGKKGRGLELYHFTFFFPQLLHTIPFSPSLNPFLLFFFFAASMGRIQSVEKIFLQCKNIRRDFQGHVTTPTGAPGQRCGGAAGQPSDWVPQTLPAQGSGEERGGQVYNETSQKQVGLPLTWKPLWLPFLEISVRKKEK